MMTNNMSLNYPRAESPNIATPMEYRKKAALEMGDVFHFKDPKQQ